MSDIEQMIWKEKSVFMNIIKKVILSVLGLLQGTLGSYLALLGLAFAFPGTAPGARDYEEDMLFVPFGYLIILIWIAIMASAFIFLHKNKTNFLAFIVSWIIGLVGTLIAAFVLT